MYHIEIKSGQGETLAQAQGDGDARLVYMGEYAPGDVITFTAPREHVCVLVDQAVTPGTVFLPEKTFTFAVPFGDPKNGYAPQAFMGGQHSIWIGPAGPVTARRNVARNPLDQRADAGCYPHASANVETRDEAQFFARNVIDGTRFNDKHGKWPYHSWGVGERTDAWLRIDFGRPMLIDEVVLTLRADFPHDAWWERVTIRLSDGYETTLPLIKTAEAQAFAIGLHTVTWLTLSDMVKADDPSPFPALTQIEVYGYDAQ